MYYLTILLGIILGVILFLFLFIAAKRTGLYFLSPLITFLGAIGIIVFSVMRDDAKSVDYGLIGIGFLIAAVVSALLLPAKLRTSEKRSWSKGDVAGLIFLPCLLTAMIVFFMYFNEDNWMFEKEKLSYNVTDTSVTNIQRTQ